MSHTFKPVLYGKIETYVCIDCNMSEKNYQLFPSCEAYNLFLEEVKKEKKLEEKKTKPKT